MNGMPVRAYEDANGTRAWGFLRDETLHLFRVVENPEVTTTKEFWEIDDAHVENEIAAGHTGTGYAVKYAIDTLGYHMTNFGSGFYAERHDRRAELYSAGYMNRTDFWASSLVDASGTVLSFGAGGTATRFVAGRAGAGYEGQFARFASFGAGFDVAHQATQRVNYEMSGGLSGQSAFSPVEFVLMTVGSGVLGVGSKFVANSQFWQQELRSPIYLKPQFAQANTGALPIGVRNPFVNATWRVGRHGNMPSPRPAGYQSHHGVNNVWAEANLPGFHPDAAPAVLMKNDPFHNATRGVFNRFLSELAKRQGVSPRDVDWSKVSPGSAWRLAEEQFEAALAPERYREEYFRQWNKYLESLPK